MSNRYIFSDIEEAQQNVINLNFRVFEVLRGEQDSILTHKIIKNAYRSIYHQHFDVPENNEWGMNNSLREEGVEIHYKGTDFGLEEVIVTKIK